MLAIIYQYYVFLYVIEFCQPFLSFTSKIQRQENYVCMSQSKLKKVVDCYRQKQPPEVFCKAVLKNFAIFTGKNLCWILFLINLKAFKSSGKQVFSCENCESCKCTYFEKHLGTAAFI